MLVKLLSALFAPKTVLRRVPEGEKLSRVLVLRQDKLGDMVVTLPALRGLRDAFDGAEIAVVASTKNEVILKHEEGFVKITYAKAPWRFVASLLRARRFRPDAVVDLQLKGSATSLLYALFCGARWRIRARWERTLPFNVQVELSGNEHAVEAAAKVISALGVEIDPARLDGAVKLGASEIAFAQKFWSISGVDPKGCVAVNVSAGAKSRMWGEHKFVALCSHIARRGLTPLVIYSPADAQLARGIAGASGAKLAPQTPTVLHAAAIIQKTKMLISPDTSLVHIAAGFGVPVIGLYPKGEMNLIRWRPWGVESFTLQSNDPNSIEDIPVQEVIAAFDEMMRRTKL